MTITEMLDTLETAEKAATRGPWVYVSYDDDWCMRVYGVYAPDVPGRAGKPTRGNLTCQPVAYAEHDRAPEVRDEDMDAIAAMRNTLPALLAWAREATTLLAAIDPSNVPYHQNTVFSWVCGLCGARSLADDRLHAEDCTSLAARALLTRDLEVPQ